MSGRRDFILIRTILELSEEAAYVQNTTKKVTLNSFQGYEPAVVALHVRMLREAGFTQTDWDGRSDFIVVSRMTWAGHNLLDTIRHSGTDIEKLNWTWLSEHLN